MRFILTRCSERVPDILLEGSPDGAAAGAAAGFAAGGGGAAATAGAGAGAGFGGGGGAAGAGAGAAAAAGAAALAGAAPGLILNKSCPGLTVSPSFTIIAVKTPANGAGTGTVVLSVSISMTASSAPKESPTLQVNLKERSISMNQKPSPRMHLLDVALRNGFSKSRHLHRHLGPHAVRGVKTLATRRFVCGWNGGK